MSFYRCYYLFAGETYYPSGGARDLQGKFDTIEEARAAWKGFAGDDEAFKWYHITDENLNVLEDG